MKNRGKQQFSHDISRNIRPPPLSLDQSSSSSLSGTSNHPTKLSEKSCRNGVTVGIVCNYPAQGGKKRRREKKKKDRLVAIRSTVVHACKPFLPAQGIDYFHFSSRLSWTRSTSKVVDASSIHRSLDYRLIVHRDERICRGWLAFLYRSRDVFRRSKN